MFDSCNAIDINPGTWVDPEEEASSKLSIHGTSRLENAEKPLRLPKIPHRPVQKLGQRNLGVPFASETVQLKLFSLCEYF
jgi:hypothetical protein